jgi:hypothetical protein
VVGIQSEHRLKRRLCRLGLTQPELRQPQQIGERDARPPISGRIIMRNGTLVTFL